MNNKIFIALFIFLVGFLSYSTYLKMKENSQQEFSVITWQKYNICFLVPDLFTVEKDATGFKYTGDKNTGHIVLTEKIKFDPDYLPTMIGDFEASYKKVKNLRLFQYKIQDNVILEDTFDFAKKKPANIIPVRKNCLQYKKRYKKLFDL